MPVPTLSVRNLTKRFDSAGKQTGIFNVSLDLQEGEVTCVVGPSGAGKTTFLRCLAGLEQVDAGSITLLGQYSLDERTQTSLQAQREHVTMVFQDFNLWPHLTVMENILLPATKAHGILRPKAETRACDLLKKFDLHEKRKAFPDALSGGQKQRVALIRALATEPKLLLLDEITSALDPELVTSVLNAIKILAKEGQSMVIATHHLKFATEVADKILFLENGRMLQESSARDFVFAQDNPRISDFVRSLALDKPEINVSRGYDAFQAFQLGTLNRFKSGSSKNVAGSSGDRWFEAMGDAYETYERIRLARGIKWKMTMYDESARDRDLRLRYPNLNEYRLLPRHLENPANYYVNGDLVVIQIFGKPGDEPALIEITNPHVAQSYQNYFNLLWEQSGPIGNPQENLSPCHRGLRGV